MKKVLFLMFLLFLIGLGTANVKAQVAIGANTVPHPGAVLDLKSTNQGLLLPHVALSDVAVFGLAGTASQAVGMMVYNTNASITNGNGVGVYVWDGNNWKVSAGGGIGQSGVLDTIRGANGTYRIWCFPASTGLGCWMVDNSKEGTPGATTFPGYDQGQMGYYYNATQSLTACPTGWQLPTDALWQALIRHLSSPYASADSKVAFTVLQGTAGYYNVSSWVNVYETAWRSTSTYTARLSYGTVRWVATEDLASLLSVRCIRTS